MRDRKRSKWPSKYLILMVAFLLVVNLSLGFLLMRQSQTAIINLMQTRMLDISNTAASMIDGDVLENVSPADKGTDGYEKIMKTLTYFQDNIELKYIYCIRDMGDGTFTFGLDPTVEDPGEFGSPIVYTDALYKASRGTAAADDEFYEDAWGKFYSAYSPVYNSGGKVAGIIAVDFSADWYEQHLVELSRTTIIVAILSLLIGGLIVIVIITRSERKIGNIHGKLDEMASVLMKEMGKDPNAQQQDQKEEAISMNAIEQRIQSMQSVLKSQIAQVHVQAYQDGMTGVKSKHAYLETEKLLDEKVSEGVAGSFGIVVCDINNLKRVNDTYGHIAGDEYIRQGSNLICEIFDHSPVYRIGGDEFVVILADQDYENRKELLGRLHDCSVDHIASKEVIVSGGMAEFIPGQDHSVREIFDRADEEMYKEKLLLKSIEKDAGNQPARMTGDEPEAEESQLLNIRRHILIADDIASNREILGDLLADDYDIIYASDGVETMEILRKYKDDIALLLLDLYMPNMTGREVMTQMQVDEELMFIPVIVLTVDQEAELDCLKIGAVDFIPKPYPDIEIIKARIAKSIELSENRDLIRRTQRDKLTGLYNFDYFLRYVKRFDRQHRDAPFDAAICYVDHFYSVVEENGQMFGDLVLRSIGISFSRLARKTGGIGCRREGNMFLLYCPHQENYEDLLERFSSDLFIEEETAGKVHLKFGVFANAQRRADVKERFACAQNAADSVVTDPDVICGLKVLESSEW